MASIASATNGDAPAEKWMILGKSGWLGGMLIKLLTDKGKDFVLANSRTYNRESLAAELDEHKPTHVLNASGVTGRPNVDWCETHQAEALRSNVIGSMNVADLCEARGIHHTLYATGCIFEYDEAHTIGGKGFTEDDKPNFDGSFYSKTKGFLEDMLRSYSTTLCLRVRMPISDDLAPRNFVTKIVRYDKVVNIPNSMTVLADLMPMSVLMAEHKLEGIYNFCNPGAISHNEILDMYKATIDPSFEYTNFTVEQQDKILEAKRSNNELDSDKLVNGLASIGGAVPEIHESMEALFVRMKAALIAAHGVDYHSTLPKKLSQS